MKGALIFLASFVVFLVITLVYPILPPGIQIYNALGIAQSSYPVVGIPVTTLVCAVFNGVIYGVIIWLIYSLATRGKKPAETPSEQ